MSVVTLGTTMPTLVSSLQFWRAGLAGFNFGVQDSNEPRQHAAASIAAIRLQQLFLRHPAAAKVPTAHGSTTACATLRTRTGKKRCGVIYMWQYGVTVSPPVYLWGVVAHRNTVHTPSPLTTHVKLTR